MTKAREKFRHGVAVLIFGVITLSQVVADEKKPLNIMRYSCKAQLFLEASVSTAKRDGVPKTEISLTDPASHQQGVNARKDFIPRSWYKVVAAIPKYPAISTQHSVEICGAKSGEYLLSIYEHGNEQYRAAVSVTGKNNAVSLPEKFQSQEGRVRQFKFRLESRDGEVNLTWLDEKGNPQLHAANNDW